MATVELKPVSALFGYEFFVPSYQRGYRWTDVQVKFGIPSIYDQKNAYSMWWRIVYNIVTNSAFESRREDICEAFVFIEEFNDFMGVCW